jgi:hypothetical protein
MSNPEDGDDVIGTTGRRVAAAAIPILTPALIAEARSRASGTAARD